MTTSLLPIAQGAATSAEFTIGAGVIDRIFLTDADGGGVPFRSSATVQRKSNGGQFQNVAWLDFWSPSAQVQGPGTFRVVRRGDTAVGVDRDTGADVIAAVEERVVVAAADTYKTSMARALIGRPSVRKVAIWGDSVAAQNAVQTGITYYGGAFVPQALFMANNPAALVAVGGNSGYRTDQIIPTYAAQIAAHTPDIVIICAGTNDLMQSHGADYAINGVCQMARLVEAGGAVPVMMTICAGESFSSSPALLSGWIAFNAAIRAICTSTGWPLLDAATAYVDPSSITYAPLPGYTDGAVHPRNKGATAIADLLSQLFSGIPRRQLAAAADSSGDICSNVLLTGTSGTLQAGATGIAPTGGTVQNGGPGWSAISSVKRRTDGGAGYWWECSVTADSSSLGGCDLLLPIKSMASAGVAVGDTVRFLVDTEIDAGHSAVLSAQAKLRFIGGSTQWYYSHSPESANGTLRSGALKMQHMIEATIPVGTTTISLYASIKGVAGAGAYTFRAGNPSCQKIA